MPERCWAGFDGCRTGWVMALVHHHTEQHVPAIPDGTSRGARADGDGDGATRRRLTWAVHAQFADAMAAARQAGAGAIGVDMPIGMSSDGRRLADGQARALLGSRRSTVFPTPVRAVLDATDYRDALRRSRQACGVGLSKQAWNLMAKIAEVDRVVRPEHEALVFEVHPELAFSRLAGEVVLEPKRSPAGQRRRLELIAGAIGLDGSAIDALVRGVRGSGAALDDVLDAAAVALSAELLVRGEGTVLGDGARDPLGRVMRICF